jgi:biopolymer transport protein ExbB
MKRLLTRRRAGGVGHGTGIAAWVTVFLALMIHAPISAIAQPEGFDLDEPVASRASDTGARSFAEQFFISMKTDPATGEKHIELLGSLIIWFLLALSMASLGLIGHMSLNNQRKSILPSGVAEETRRMLERGEYRTAIALLRREQSYFSLVLAAALSEANHGFNSMIRSLEQTSDELTTDRLRRIEYLNVLGQVSPMIGLFGTVYGMILAFQSIVVAGGNADPVLLAGGIGIVRNKIDGLTAEATLVAEELINQFRPKPKAETSKRRNVETSKHQNVETSKPEAPHD